MFMEYSCQRAASLRFMADGWASFLVTDPLVQNHPNQSTKPMRDRSDGFPVSKARYQPAIHDLEDASFELDRGISRLVEDSSHVAVACRAAGALVCPCTLFVPRTCDCACARCKVPERGSAPARFWQLGLQYCSSAPQTGFQY